MVPAPPDQGVADAATEVLHRRALERVVELMREHRSPEAFFQAALDCVARTVGTPYAALEIQLSDSVLEREYATSPRNVAFWKDPVQSVLTDALGSGAPRARMYRSDQLDARPALLGVPLWNGSGQVIGALAMVTACSDELEAKETLAFLHCLTLMISAFESMPEAPAANAPAAAGPPPSALSKLAGFSSITELAFSITNGLQNRSQCQQVALGQVRGRTIRLLAVSGLSEVKKSSPGTALILAAMEECLDLDETALAQPSGHAAHGDETKSHPLHVKWREQASGDCVASLPLRRDGACAAVLSLRRKPSEPFDAEQLEEYRGLVEPYIHGMELVARANRGLPRHALQVLLESLLDWRSVRSWLRRALLAAVLGLVVFIGFGRLEYRLTVPCLVSPGSVRQIAAPFDAVLRSADFAPGDSFEAGAVVCRLDTRDLEHEHTRLDAELAILELDRRAALAQGRAAEVELLRRKRDRMRAMLSIAEERIARSTIRVPFAGRVLSGDLRLRIGDAVSKGETLFELSPREGWRLELDVSAADIAQIADGQTGQFASAARPEDVHPLRVRRILPSPRSREGETVYVVEADSTVDSDWMLAGMEGMARVEIGERPAWWILFHPLLDSLRLRFWL